MKRPLPKPQIAGDSNRTVLKRTAVLMALFGVAELGLSGQDLDAIADKLSSLLNVSAEKIRTLMEDTSYRYQIVKRKVEQEEAASVRAYLSEETITGVYLEPDTRRYYPYGTLAAQVLGFVGSDNTGLDGIEAAENQTLSGSGGSIATAKGT